MKSMAIAVGLLLVLSGAIACVEPAGVSGARSAVYSSAYAAHDPIRIDSNADFDAAHGVLNWDTGNGTSWNPWVIENYDINGTGYGYCIYIGNTTDHFTIKDCYLHEANGFESWPYYHMSGIALIDVHNGRVTNNTAAYNDHMGILLNGTSGVNVTDNLLTGNAWGGLYALGSDGNDFSGNNASSNDQYSFYLELSDGNEIVANACENNGYDAMIVICSNNNIITNNSAYDNGGFGLYQWMSNGNEICGNDISGNEHACGIYLEDSDANRVSNNTMLGNGYDGIASVSCDGNTVSNNTFDGERFGIYYGDSFGNTLSGNKMTGCGILIFGEYREHWNEFSIDASNTVNGKPVRYLKNQNGGTVPPGAGQVILANCTGVLVADHNLSNGAVGVELGYSSGNVVTDNTAIDNDYTGIYLGNSHGNTISNNIGEGDESGICLYNSGSNEVSGNDFSNTDTGIYLHGSTSTVNANAVDLDSAATECSAYPETYAELTAPNGRNVQMDGGSGATLTFSDFQRGEPLWSEGSPGRAAPEGAPHAAAEQADLVKSQCRDGTVLFKLKQDFPDIRLSLVAAEAVASEYGAKTAREYPNSGVYRLTLNDGISVTDIVRRLSIDPRILYAEPDRVISLSNVPDDPGFESLWGLRNTGQTWGTPGADISAVEAWDISTGSADVVVAVIDTGVDYNHEDLAANMWTNVPELSGIPGVDDDGNGYVDDIHGIDSRNNDSDPMDDHSHGTHCAGTIGAVGNNGIGVAGVNWAVSIMALKFIGADGNGYESDAIECMEYAIKMKMDYGVNIKVTSNSWGGYVSSQAVYDAISALGEASILFVAAAGNEGVDTDYVPHFPSAFNLTNIISVAATDDYDDLSQFSSLPYGASNYGTSTVDVAAPGSYINSTVLDDSYGYKSGTSMATPHVAGLVALIASCNPGFGPIEIKNLIMSTADRLPSLSNKMVAEGRINAYQALTYTPEGMQMTVQSPGDGNRVLKGAPLDLSFSLSDGIHPIAGATVTVDFSDGTAQAVLHDDGIGTDQTAGDGYYGGSRTFLLEGSVILTVNATAGGYDDVSETVAIVVVSGNVLANNTANNCRIGVRSSSSSHNLISNNTLLNAKWAGTYLYQSNNNVIANNTIYDHLNYGIGISSSNHNSVANNTASNGEIGLYLNTASNNQVVNNTFSYNGYSANAFGSWDNTIYHNNFIENVRLAEDDTGANLWDDGYPSGGNYWSAYVGGDAFSGPDQDVPGSDGIGDEPYPDILGGQETMDVYPLVYPARTGLLIPHLPIRIDSDADFDRAHGVANWDSGEGSPANPWTISDLDVDGTGYGYCIYIGNTTECFVLGGCALHGADGGAGGWPYFCDSGLIMYNVRNGNVSENAVHSNAWEGIYVESSDDNVFADNALSSNGGDGIYAYDSENTVIVGNTIASNLCCGIVVESGSSRVEGNTVTENGVGIVIGYSDDALVADNDVSKNEYGLYGMSVNGITFDANDVTRNIYGIYLTSSNDNAIYHNYFLDNDLQAYDDGANEWDDGYPSGGNYWSDHLSGDAFSGPDQDIPSADGICDSPYYIDVGVWDHYPLCIGQELVWCNISIVAGWNLISVPLGIPSLTLPAQLLDSDTLWDRVMWYDPANAQDHWKQFNTAWSWTMNDLSRVEASMGFWINVTDPGDGYLNVNGFAPVSTQINLKAGWNLVGYPTLSANVTVATAFWGTGADIVEVFDPGAPYMTAAVGPDYVMQPGEGYWVHVAADSVWTVDW